MLEKIFYQGQELLPIKSDIVFKAFFSKESNKDLLASFLSSILDIDIDPDGITYLNSEINAEAIPGKMIRLDVRIKTSNNEHIDVEMQVANQHNMEKRSLYYLSQLYTKQMTTEQTYRQLGRAIAINILDFELLPGDAYHSVYRMKNIATSHELTDIFEIDFIELPKVKENDLDRQKNVWATFLSMRNSEVLEMMENKGTTFNKAVSELKMISSDKKMQLEYEARRSAELDWLSSMETNYIRGIEKGVEKGIEKGIEKGKLDTARVMLAKSFPIPIISDITGLSESDIQELNLS